MQTHIPVNKKVFLQLWLITIGAVTLLFLLTKDMFSEFTNDVYYYLNIISFAILYIYAIVFISILLINTIKLLSDKTTGFLIDDDGITSNVGIISSTRLIWSDIRGMSIYENPRSHQKIIILLLADTEAFLARKNLFQKFILKKYNQRYGSPVFISQRAIDYDIGELQQLLLHHLQKADVYRNNFQNAGQRQFNSL